MQSFSPPFIKHFSLARTINYLQLLFSLFIVYTLFLFEYRSKRAKKAIKNDAYRQSEQQIMWLSVIKTSIISSLNCDGFDGCELIMTIYNQVDESRKNYAKLSFFLSFYYHKNWDWENLCSHCGELGSVQRSPRNLLRNNKIIYLIPSPQYCFTWFFIVSNRAAKTDLSENNLLSWVILNNLQ